MLDTYSIITDDGGTLSDDFEFHFESTAQDAATVMEGIDTSTDDGVAIAEAVAGKSKIIELSLDVYSNGEKVGGIHNFEKPLTVRISLADVPDADPDKVGAYYIDETSGKPVFMGGKIVTVDGVRMLEFETSHLSKFAVLEAVVSYPDVSAHWSKGYVESMGAKHVINGYPDGTFLPEKAVTRVEFAKMVVEAMGYEAVEYAGAFPDVSEGDWYAGYVATAEANGIVLGYPDGTFKPNQKISRLVMATMLSRAYNAQLAEEKTVVLSAFADNGSIAEWGTEYAAKSVEAGFMNGMDGMFNPDGTTTRAQAATAIYRLFNK